MVSREGRKGGNEIVEIKVKEDGEGRKSSYIMEFRMSEDAHCNPDDRQFRAVMEQKYSIKFHLDGA